MGDFTFRWLSVPYIIQVLSLLTLAAFATFTRGERMIRAALLFLVATVLPYSLGLALVGSPETVTKQLKAQHQLIGYDIFCANHRFGPLPQEQSSKSMRLFAEEVMPAFRE